MKLKRSGQIVVGIIVAAICGLTIWKVANDRTQTQFVSAMTSEAETMLAITNSYVSTYASVRGAKGFSGLPVPAKFRADANAHYNRNSDNSKRVKTTLVGLPGKSIATPPTDPLMARQIQHIVDTGDITVQTHLLSIDGVRILRSLFPSIATRTECVTCHNNIQAELAPWKLNDMMGTYVVDRRVGAELTAISQSSALYGVLCSMIVIAAALIYRYSKIQRAHAALLKQYAYNDALTGCLNRRALFDKFENLSTSSRGTLIMLDIDHFKVINDTWGHAAGDVVLEHFSDLLESSVRGSDWVARIGGEEFVLWLPDCEYSAASATAERIRDLVASTPVQINSDVIQYTVSIGVLTVQKQDVFDFAVWLKAVDELLYRAKRAGRNRLFGADGLQQ